ncbi:hypothetical protein N3K66_005892 [Trichothecium roseum]|uniref:Uncharacterized protein n=1 Tax=Trichothecium roseum TaxID=47278 RepID=A0ACC0UZF5_9HYPO|nr:hypothetical protein N3K66_005892 [Trichothecium roseum]
MPSNTSKTNSNNVTSDAVSEVTLVDTYGSAVDSKSGAPAKPQGLKAKLKSMASGSSKPADPYKSWEARSTALMR